jgi:hypothetical protein
VSVLATTGDEIAVGYRWIMERLRTDTGAGGLRATGSPALVTGIYADEAPQGTGLPYVVVGYQAGDPIAATNSADEVMARLRYLVRAVVAGVDPLPAAPIAERVHLRLHKGSGAYAAGSVQGEVLSCVRLALESYVEGTGSEPRFRNHGHQYELLAQSA